MLGTKIVRKLGESRRGKYRGAWHAGARASGLRCGGAAAFFDVGGHHGTVKIVGHREHRVERVTSCWAGTSEQVR